MGALVLLKTGHFAQHLDGFSSRPMGKTALHSELDHFSFQGSTTRLLGDLARLRLAIGYDGSSLSGSVGDNRPH